MILTTEAHLIDDLWYHPIPFQWCVCRTGAFVAQLPDGGATSGLSLDQETLLKIVLSPAMAAALLADNGERLAGI